MAAVLADELKIQAKLIKGGGGIFDVVADGELVFSKHEVGDFPDESSVIQKLKGS